MKNTINYFIFGQGCYWIFSMYMYLMQDMFKDADCTNKIISRGIVGMSFILVSFRIDKLDCFKSKEKQNNPYN